MMELQVQIRNVYGTDTIYPINDEAKTFAEIAGTKTLTLRTIQLAKRLGFKVTQHYSTFGGI